MKIDDAELKRLLQEGMDYEADCIMEEVESDPNIQDVVAPEEIYDNLLKQIREREDELEKEKEALSREQQELIRLGKIYKKKRGRRKYIVLIAAVVCALGVGTISFGDKSKVFMEMKRLLTDKEQTVINTGDEDTSFAKDIASEEDAYEQIYNKFGFYPVRMLYLPEQMEFTEVVVEEESQNVRIFYQTDTQSISVSVLTNYRTGSVGIDMDDKQIQQYEKTQEGIVIKFQEYLIEESGASRWMLNFSYEDAQYSIVITGLEQKEVEKIVENLYFS